MRERDRFGVLILMQQGIERHQHLHPIRMGILHHLRQIIQRVTSRLSRSECWRTDIDRVRACLNSRFGYFFVASRSEEAKR